MSAFDDDSNPHDNAEAVFLDGIAIGIGPAVIANRPRHHLFCFVCNL